MLSSWLVCDCPNGHTSTAKGTQWGIEPISSTDALASSRDHDAVPQFVAGWLYGITYHEDDLRDEIVACYKKVELLEDDYFEGMAACDDGDTITCTEKFADAAKYYEEAFGSCDDSITDELRKWSEKYADLQTTEDWDKISE